MTAWTPKSLEAARIFEAEASLHFFIRLMWSVLEPATPFTDGWWPRAWCEHLEAIEDGRITRLLGNCPPGACKALDDDTPIFTTWGWKRHGDLLPGDFVFGPDGQPKRVIAVSEQRLELSFDVRFDDGASIVAAGDHLWEVDRDYMRVGPKYSRGKKREIVTTRDLRVTGYKQGDTNRRPDRIELCHPLAMPTRRLMIDPYVFGAWLGDGASGSGVIYSGEQDIAHFQTLGKIAHVYEPNGSRKQNFYRITIEDLQVKLRVMGILHNKHIPLDYMESSIEQRWELLRGLMDTDGTCTESGACILTAKREEFARSIRDLAQSLGLKAGCSQHRSRLNGMDYGFHWRVQFTPRAGDIVFKLERKQSRIVGSVSPRSRGRYVVAVEPVGKRLVRCIQVEGNLYLAGRQFTTTHNSLMTSVFFPAWCWGPRKKPSMRFLTAAYSQTLTERDNDRMRMLIQSPEYQSRWGHVFKAGDSKIYFQNDKTGFKLASSVGGTITGLRADCVILDDVNNINESESKTVRENTNRWLSEVMPTRLNNMELSSIIMIQQRTHEEDATGFLLRSERGGDKWTYVMVPMLYDPSWTCGETTIGWRDPRTITGELFWPERFPAKVVADLREEMSPYAFAGQLQQHPEPRGGAIIKRDWWKLYGKEDEDPTAVKLRFPAFSYLVASLDCALTDKSENDPSALVILGVWTVPQTGRMAVMVVYCWAMRLQINDLVKEVAKTCDKYHVDRLIIENKANGHSVQQEIRRMYADADWGVEMIDPHDVGTNVYNKIARVNSVTHLFEEGMIWHPNTEWASGTGGLIEEVSIFPRGSHDDRCDALVQGLRHLRDRGILFRRQEERQHEQSIASLARGQTIPRSLYEA